MLSVPDRKPPTDPGKLFPKNAKKTAASKHTDQLEGRLQDYGTLTAPKSEQERWRAFRWIGGCMLFFIVLDMVAFTKMETWGAPIGIVFLQFLFILFLCWLTRSRAFTSLLAHIFTTIQKK